MSIYTPGEQHFFDVPLPPAERKFAGLATPTGAMSINITSEAEADEIAQFSRAQRQRQASRATPNFTAEIASKQEVTYRGGEMVSATSMHKTQDAITHYAFPTVSPGNILVPGFGETTVEAAKAAGLLPADWKEGDANPFSDPAKGTEAGTKDTKADDLTVLQHQAKVAGQILEQVDKVHGGQVTDAYLNQAVETGEIPEDGLPAGVTPLMVKQVYTGYVAQANAALATVGASVPLLSEVMTDAELLQARRATLANSKEELAALGQLAVSRLAQMPMTDPEGFKEMLADMPPAERKCLRFDSARNEWIVSIPGKPLMSFGSAVHAGFIRV